MRADEREAGGSCQAAKRVGKGRDCVRVSGQVWGEAKGGEGRRLFQELAAAVCLMWTVLGQVAPRVLCAAGGRSLCLAWGPLPTVVVWKGAYVLSASQPASQPLGRVKRD